jgi:hypothetical protein
MTIPRNVSNLAPGVSTAGVLNPSNGGTGSSTTFTLGSVVFAGSSGVYTQNNSLFFWDNTNSRLGIGTNTPAAKFDLLGDYKEGVVTANTTTSYTISLANGTLQILTLTGNCTFTFPTATAGQSFMMFLKQDATGSRTATWPASVKWPSSTAPTITSTLSKGDKFVFTADGTYWWGSNAGQNYL